MVQHGEDFLTLPVSILDAAKQKSRTLDNLFARYADCVLAQILQNTACNAAHNIEQRAAKWIVSAMERTHDDEAPLTQERLSSMLGVGRSYVSRATARLKDDGIRPVVRRGYILILRQGKTGGAILSLQRNGQGALQRRAARCLSGR